MDPISINDLAGLSEPAKKLIEVVSSGIGKLYEPSYIRKVAEAEADASIIRARSNAAVNFIQAKDEAQRRIIAWQTQERIRCLEERRQRNINQILGIGIDQLPATIESQNKIDEDWIIQFLNLCQDVGSEEMQMLWGQLLAGEVSEPGKYSYRTMFVLKMLRRSDAMKFKKFCNYLWDNEFVFIKNENEEVVGLSEEDIRQLILAELVSNDLTFGFKIGKESSKQFDYFGKKYLFTNPSNKFETFLPYWRLSNVGFELRSLCNPSPEPDYVRALIKNLGSAGEYNMVPIKVTELGNI